MGPTVVKNSVCSFCNGKKQRVIKSPISDVRICIDCLAESAKLQYQEREPVKTDDGKLEEFTLKIAGENYRCGCGCNVFHKPDNTKPNLYKCNACIHEFEAYSD